MFVSSVKEMQDPGSNPVHDIEFVFCIVVLFDNVAVVLYSKCPRI